MKIFILAAGFMSIVSAVPVYAASARDGVLATANAGQGRDYTIEQQVNQLIETAMIRMMIRTMGEVIEQTSRQARIGLMPDFAYMAAQQGALQCFRQDSLMEVIREIYKEAGDYAVRALNDGESPGSVREEVERRLDRDLHALVHDPVYQQVAQKVIELVYQNQQTVVMQNVMQQHLQNLSQQQQQTHKALVEQYQKSLLIR